MIQKQKRFFPDIIVHQRNNDDNNLLVIEVKKSSNAQDRFDKTKIIAFTKEPYRYKFGLFLKISMNGTDDSLIWYRNGRAIDE